LASGSTRESPSAPPGLPGPIASAPPGPPAETGFPGITVPSILGGIPSIVVVLFIAVQLLGAAFWLPVARRMIGEMGLRPPGRSGLLALRRPGRRFPFGRGGTAEPQVPRRTG